MVHTTGQNYAERYRQHLKKVLESAEFGNSRQARDFLSYVAEAALDGRSQLGQAEIVERVLKRGNDFNPLDDASVRKNATLTRQKLERYYATEGKSDAVLVSLPLRSYMPVFSLRSSSEQAGGEMAAGIPQPVVLRRPSPAHVRF